MRPRSLRFKLNLIGKLPLPHPLGNTTRVSFCLYGGEFWMGWAFPLVSRPVASPAPHILCYLRPSRPGESSAGTPLAPPPPPPVFRDILGNCRRRWQTGPADGRGQGKGPAAKECLPLFTPLRGLTVLSLGICSGFSELALHIYMFCF